MLVGLPEEPHHHQQRPTAAIHASAKAKRGHRRTGLDFAFDCAGVPAVREQAASALGRNGSLILVGFTPHLPKSGHHRTRFRR
jgi:threonine dehydrogenase-like Zn-dependent dehydrogenase